MGFTLFFYCPVFNANDIFCDLTMITNDLNMPYKIKNHIFCPTAILEKMFNMCLPATSITLRKRYLK